VVSKSFVINSYCLHCMVVVAQLVERRSVEAKVVGAEPIYHPKMIILNKEETLERKEEIISAIKAGKIFIYPTDTIYGLGCDATNEEAVKKLREIKNRENKPFSVIAPGKKWIIESYKVNQLSRLDILPGPYTVILNYRNKNVLSDSVFLDALPGVRIPKNWFTDIISEAGVPFVTTSVNISGEKHMEKLDDISNKISEKVDYCIYEGPIFGKQSMRIDLTK
jgi:L-threonylcarbamoyladenylate synthase